MKFKCPHCQRPISCPDSAAGKRGKCPSCGEIVTVPRIQAKWYYVKNRQRFGPFSKQQLIQKARSGAFTEEDLVWTKSLGEHWAKAWKIPELFGAGIIQKPVPKKPPEKKPASPPSPVPAPASKPITKAAVAEMLSAGIPTLTLNSELQRRAREKLQGRWGLAVGASALIMFIAGFAGSLPFIGLIAMYIIMGPLLLGYIHLFYSIYNKEEATISQMFSGFQRFSVTLSAFLLMNFFVTLWSLLLFVPGIIASLAYSQTFFIINEDENIGAREAINKSKAMMDGKKWKLFCLHYRFYGWYLLSMLTFGIGLFWLVPYMHMSMIEFYKDISGEKTNTN